MPRQSRFESLGLSNILGAVGTTLGTAYGHMTGYVTRQQARLEREAIAKAAAVELDTAPWGDYRRPASLKAPKRSPRHHSKSPAPADAALTGSGTTTTSEAIGAELNGYSPDKKPRRGWESPPPPLHATATPAPASTPAAAPASSKFLGAGTYGCVLAPPLPASGLDARAAASVEDAARPYLTVSKVFSDEKEAEKEIKAAKPMYDLDPHQAYGLYPLSQPLRIDDARVDSISQAQLQKCSTIPGIVSASSKTLSPEARMVLVPRGTATWEAWVDRLPQATLAEACASIHTVYAAWRHLRAGLRVYHAGHRVHLDIKEQNTLMVPDGAGGLSPRFIDFGFARSTERPSTTDEHNLPFYLYAPWWSFPLRQAFALKWLSLFVATPAGTPPPDDVATEVALKQEFWGLERVIHLGLNTTTWLEDAHACVESMVRLTAREGNRGNAYYKWRAAVLESTDIYQLGLQLWCSVLRLGHGVMEVDFFRNGAVSADPARPVRWFDEAWHWLVPLVHAIETVMQWHATAESLLQAEKALDAQMARVPWGRAAAGAVVFGGGSTQHKRPRPQTVPTAPPAAKRTRT